MRSLVHRRAALADLDAIYDYIEPDSPRRAASFVKDIRGRCRPLRAHPKLGRARDYPRHGIHILPVLVRVVVAHRIAPRAILITRVFYGGQNYEAISRRDEHDGDPTPE